MSRLKFYIDGQELETKPLEFQDLQVSVDWTGDRNVQIEFDKLTFRNTDTDDIATRIIAMRSDSLGVFNGRPFNIEVDGYALPDMMLNLRKGFKQNGNAECQVSVEMVNQKDKVSTDLSVLQFKRLEEDGEFSTADYTQVPYNINYIPDALQLIIIGVAIFNISKSVGEFVKGGADSTAETTTAVIPAAPIFTITVGQIALAVAKVIIRIAYFILLAIALKKLAQQLAEQLYSVTRYHSALKIKSMFRVMCSHVGLAFESDLLDGAFESQLVLMPSKTEKGRVNQSILNGGAPNRNDSGLYFAGEFLTSMMQAFNADYRIKDGVLRFERWDWWRLNSTTTLESNYTNQERRLTELTDNADEFKGGYYLAFDLDQQDRNTVDKIYGSAYDVITNVVNSNGVEYNLAHGGEEINFPFSYGIRKDTLTGFEKVLKALFKLVDATTNLFGNGTSLVSQIENRKGNLQLSDHFTSKPKLLLMEGSHGLAANQQSVMNAKIFWDRYHYINSFYPINGIHNQWKEKPPMLLQTNSTRFADLLDNNFCKDANGNDVEVQKLKWTMEMDKAEITTRTNEQYEFNLQQNYVIAQNSPLNNSDD